MLRLLIVLGLWCAAAAVAAADEVYRVVDADGHVHYTDRPPHRRARPLDLGVPSGATPPPRRAGSFHSAEALRAAARFAVSVESPTPGQILRAAAAPAVVAASVMPGLVSGFGLTYVLDGRALNATPVDSLSLLLPALEPGARRLTVILSDAQGREQARADEIVFHVAP